jgi:hypothetical protein
LKAKLLESSFETMYETIFQIYLFLKIEILLVPLLAKSHIFEISEDVHSYIHDRILDFTNLSFPRVEIAKLMLSFPRMEIDEHNMLPSTFPNIIFHENSTACNDIIFPESIP